MLEAYQAFADYTEMMDLVEGMVVAAATRRSRRQPGRQDRRPRRRPVPALAADHHVRPDRDSGSACGWTRRCRSTHARARARRAAAWSGRRTGAPGKLMKQLVDEKVQHEIVEPIFCVDYPQEVSPLARVHRSRPGYVERFELMVAGFELCNAYSEQNDPVAQLAAFEAEARAKAEGDPEAGDIDLDYVRALEYGLPCTGGLGIGIDRLVMLLSGADNIREVILFPTMRPEAGQPGPTGTQRRWRSSTNGLGRLDARAQRRSRRCRHRWPSPRADPAAAAAPSRRTLAHPGRAGRAGRSDPAAGADPVLPLPAAALRQSDRAGLVPGHRAPADRPHRPRAAVPGRPDRPGQAPGLAGQRRAVRARRGHATSSRVRTRSRPPTARHDGRAAVLPPPVPRAGPTRRRCSGWSGWPRSTSARSCCSASSA